MTDLKNESYADWVRQRWSNGAKIKEAMGGYLNEKRDRRGGQTDDQVTNKWTSPQPKQRHAVPAPTSLQASQDYGAPARIRTPHDHDILCGRGGSINSHPGNRRFREWVSERKESYNLTKSKCAKAREAQSIINRVRALNPPGRFLKREDDGRDPPEHGWWIEIDNDRVMVKTSQALREGAPFIRAMNKQGLVAMDPKENDGTNERTKIHMGKLNKKKTEDTRPLLLSAKLCNSTTASDSSTIVLSAKRTLGAFTFGPRSWASAGSKAGGRVGAGFVTGPVTPGGLSKSMIKPLFEPTSSSTAEKIKKEEKIVENATKDEGKTSMDATITELSTASKEVKAKFDTKKTGELPALKLEGIGDVSHGEKQGESDDVSQEMASAKRKNAKEEYDVDPVKEQQRERDDQAFVSTVRQGVLRQLAGEAGRSDEAGKNERVRIHITNLSGRNLRKKSNEDGFVLRKERRRESEATQKRMKEDGDVDKREQQQQQQQEKEKENRHQVPTKRLGAQHLVSEMGSIEKDGKRERLTIHITDLSRSNAVRANQQPARSDASQNLLEAKMKRESHDRERLEACRKKVKETKEAELENRNTHRSGIETKIGAQQKKQQDGWGRKRRRAAHMESAAKRKKAEGDVDDQWKKQQLDRDKREDAVRKMLEATRKAAKDDELLKATSNVSPNELIPLLPTPNGGFGIEGRVFVITGGTQGLGLEIARHLKTLGAAGLVLVSRSHDKGRCQINKSRAICDELSDGTSCRAVFVSADLSRPDEAAGVIPRAVELMKDIGPVSGLVNAAAAACDSSLFTTTVEQLDLQFAINVRAPFLITQAAAKHMVAETVHGSIVNIWVVASYYGSSLFSLASLTKHNAAELVPHGIRVNGIDMGWHVDDKHGKRGCVKQNPSAETTARTASLGRILHPSAVARFVAYLLSGSSCLMTGKVLDLHPDFDPSVAAP